MLLSQGHGTTACMIADEFGAMVVGIDFSEHMVGSGFNAHRD